MMAEPLENEKWQSLNYRTAVMGVFFLVFTIFMHLIIKLTFTIYLDQLKDLERTKFWAYSINPYFQTDPKVLT